MGATSALPTRVGECEQGVAALAVRAESTTGWWDESGQPVEFEGYDEQATIGTLGLGMRLSRQWELQARLPVEQHTVETTAEAFSGGGVGDSRVLMLWDPLEERPPDGKGAGPTPIAILGARLPTGRDWTESVDPMNADVTGLPHAAIIVGAQVERTLGQWPWSVGSTAELDLGAPGGLSGVGQTTATAGRYLGSSWTVLGVATYATARAEGARALVSSSSSSVGTRVVHGRTGRYRVWGGFDHGPNLAVLGRAAPRLSAATVGYARVW